MTGSILIVDSVATNRIVLKVKLVAAQYQVISAANCIEAKTIIDQQKPDLLLINLSDPVEDSHQFCLDLTKGSARRDMSIVAIGVADTNRARFAALDAGADDVLPRPISDSLMLARIRGLLRRRSANLEWCMEDDTSRVLGFEEAAAPRLTPPKVFAIPSANTNQSQLLAKLQDRTLKTIELCRPKEALAVDESEAVPDLFVIECAAEEAVTDVCRLISDLQSRPSSRTAEILALVPVARADIAARVLDLGAGDVAFGDVSSRELELRIKNLLKQKLKQDHQRERVWSGLHAAVTDPLTGLYNRRYAETRLTEISHHAQMTGQSYALMMVDIDHFKSINDRFGHAAGDQVLIKLAERLKSNFRSIDLIARIGGEEFLIAMPNTSMAQAQIAAERMRRTVNRRTFAPKEDTPAIRVTISVGVAIEQINGEKCEPTSRMFDRADAALYEAKTSGRDKVTICSNAA